ncbi:hypothetical protein EG827_12225 [bacterium]|nr:hypothetical protein [bacterium]
MANPTIDIFKPRSVTTAILSLITPEPFVLKNVFKQAIPHASDNIDCELTSYASSMAAVVGDYDGPVPVSKGSRYVQQFKVPRTFESKVFTAKDIADYEAVGNIYGENSEARAAAKNAWALNELADMKNRAIRRREYMAIQALTTGIVTVSSDSVDYSADYGFESDKQLVTLSATAKWNATSTAKPLNNIRNWKKLIAQRSGLPMDILLLGSQAADDFIGLSDVQNMMDANQIRSGVLELVNTPTIGANFLGRVAGVDVYEVVQQYDATDMFGTNLAVAVASKAAFRNHLGPVYRFNDAGQAQVLNAEYYVEAEVSNDKTMLSWKVEQKCLPVVHDKGAVIAATVHA